MYTYLTFSEKPNPIYYSFGLVLFYGKVLDYLDDYKESYSSNIHEALVQTINKHKWDDTNILSIIQNFEKEFISILGSKEELANFLTISFDWIIRHGNERRVLDLTILEAIFYYLETFQIDFVNIMRKYYSSLYN